MSNDTTTSNASKAPKTSSSSQPMTNQLSQLGRASTHSVQPGIGSEYASRSTEAQKFPGDGSGRVADEESSPDDGEHSDDNVKVRVDARKEGKSTKSDMDEFAENEALSAKRASELLSESE
jgi:hypothetical protein